MKMELSFLLRRYLILSMALFELASYASARTWTNNKGKTVEAEWVRLENEKVVAKSDKGTEIRMPLKQLSIQDQEYVKKKVAMEFVEFSHTWTLPDGKLVNAILRKVGADSVSVVDASGRQIEIQIKELSKEDKSFVGEQIKKGNVTVKKGQAPKINTITVEELMEAIRKGDKATVNSYIENDGDLEVKDKNGATPLCWAAREDKTFIAKLLLVAGAKVDSPAEWGGTPLMCAAFCGKLECVKLFLVNGAQLNVTNKEGMDPLMAAVKSNNPQIVKLLIQHGADVLAKNEKTGLRPLQLAREENAGSAVIEVLNAAVAARKAEITAAGGKIEPDIDLPTVNELIKAVEKGDAAFVQKYIAGKGPLDVRGVGNPWTPLAVAAEHGQLSIVKMLVSAGASVDFSTSWGSVPLMCAACNNKEDVVRFLLENGASVHVANGGGCTPLMEGISSNNPQIVNLLIKYGADVLSKNEKMGSTPLQYAREKGVKTSVMKVLESAIAVQKAKIREKGEIVPEDGGLSIGEVSVAIRKGNKLLVQQYISQKADLNKFDRSGWSLLLTAVEQNNVLIVKMLLDAGADVNLGKGDDKRTPIGCAAAKGNLQMVKTLLSAGAKIDGDNTYGMSPLLLAIESNNIEVVKFLLSKGADIHHVSSKRKEKNVVQFAREHSVNPMIIKFLEEEIKKSKP